MLLDLIATTGLTAGAAVAVTTLALSLMRTPAARIRLAAALAAWFAAVVALGASGALAADSGLGTPALGLTLALPIMLVSVLIFATEGGRSVLAGAPLPALIGVNTIRILGVMFVLLYAAGRLPAPFAPIAGWGDIVIGTTSPFVAWAVAHDRITARWIALGWNTLGLVDLLAAISLGVTSAPGPLRLFAGEPSSAIMTGLPWLLVPGFLVPLLMLTHLAVFARLTGSPSRHYRAAAAPV